MKPIVRLFCVVIAGTVAVVSPALARPMAVKANRAAPGGITNLPYQASDARGNQWMIFQNGALRQNGNMPLYSQGAMLIVNGNYPQQTNNQGRIDEKTGELVIENMTTQVGVTVTRRVLIQREEGYVRFIDVLKNATPQPVTLNLQIQTNLNYGINAAVNVPDPRHKEQNIAWVGQTGAGPSVVEVYCGTGSKLAPTINWQQGNSNVQAMANVDLPAGKEIALMHLHLSAATQDAGAAFVTSLRDSRLMRDIPSELRKIIVNFVSGQNYVGDVEILRGDVLDVVELRSGDQVRGTLQEKDFHLKTFYGDVTLPVDQVVAVVNVGQFRPRQLLVTADGQIFGGQLAKTSLELQLSSGQVTQVPLTQVARAGYRRRAGEPEEWAFDKPTLLMRTGERVVVQMPTATMEVVTRYGRLSLTPQTIASVILQSEEHGVHEIILTDGSRFAGLLVADTFGMKLESAGEQPVQFPASAVARMQLTGVKVAADEPDPPTLDLTNDDALVGALTGVLKVDTTFDTISVNADEIATLTHPPQSPLDVQVTLWDGSTISGQLQQPLVQCKLVSGLAMTVPAVLIETYRQPHPQASAQMLERIKAVVADLSAQDWRARDRAEAQIVTIGPVAMGILRQLRDGQPPEAQTRIDGLLKKLEEVRKSEQKTSPGLANPEPIISN